MTQKCPKLDYDEKVIRKFENHLESIGGFSEATKRREKNHVVEVETWKKVQ